MSQFGLTDRQPSKAVKQPKHVRCTDRIYVPEELVQIDTYPRNQHDIILETRREVGTSSSSLTPL